MIAIVHVRHTQRIAVKVVDDRGIESLKVIRRDE